MVDRGPGEQATLVESDREAQPPPAAPLPLPHIHSFPPLEVDASRAEVTGPVGAVAHLAGAVRELAQALPGRSVLTVEFETTDPAAPLTIAARAGDPIVLVLGEEQFEMPAGWPEPG